MGLCGSYYTKCISPVTLFCLVSPFHWPLLIFLHDARAWVLLILYVLLEASHIKMATLLTSILQKIAMPESSCRKRKAVGKSSNSN